MSYTESKIKFITLLGEGRSQKEAAKMVGVSENTASAWKKNLPAAIYISQRAEIQKKITTALADPQTSPSDISKLTDAAVKLEKCINYAMKNPLS